MTRPLAAGVVFAAVVASTASAAAEQVMLPGIGATSSDLTLVVQPTTIRSTSDRMTIFGSVSGGRADQKVTIQFKACGLQPIQFRDAFETTTQAGGRYSLEELRPFNPGVSGVYRAVSGGEVSPEIRVRARVTVYMRPLRSGRGRFEVWVGGRVSFWRRFVLLQRFERARGVWITMRRLVLSESPAKTLPFRPGVPKGTLIRAVFPLSQARPCYLAGYGPLMRT